MELELKVEHGPKFHEADANELRHLNCILAGQSVNGLNCISSPLDSFSEFVIAMASLPEVRQMRLVVAIDYGTTFTGKLIAPLRH